MVAKTCEYLSSRLLSSFRCSGVRSLSLILYCHLFVGPARDVPLTCRFAGLSGVVCVCDCVTDVTTLIESLFVHSMRARALFFRMMTLESVKLQTTIFTMCSITSITIHGTMTPHLLSAVGNTYRSGCCFSCAHELALTCLCAVEL